MLVEINIGDVVCDSNYKHQEVVWKSATEVGLVDGSRHDIVDVDIADHTYSHPVDRVLAVC